MQDQSKTFLKELLESVGPSGYEDEPGRIWRAQAERFGAEVWSDAHGSSFARLNKGGSPRVMLSGHLDEIGFMITWIDDDGFLSIQPIGGWDMQIPQGQRVWIRTDNGRLVGVVGKKPIHVLEEDDRKKVVKVEDLWIDIGAKDKEEAEGLVSIGDPVVLAWNCEELRNGLMVSRAWDDRAGAFVALEALRKLSEKGGFAAEVTAVGTVQEEIGLRGAKTAAYALDPQVGIAIDVTVATDHPGMGDVKKKWGEVSMGKGAVVARGANINPLLFKRLIDTAKAKEIAYQIDPAPRGTGTDANAIQVSRGGVATALISVPNRYMHSPCEMCSLDDLEQCSDLIAETVAVLEADADFAIT